MHFKSLHFHSFISFIVVSSPRGVRRIGLTGLKPPPPEIPRKKIIYLFKSGVFYVLQFVHPVADYVPPIQLIN